MNELVRISDLNLRGKTFIYSIYDLESLYEYLDDRMRTRCGGLIECIGYDSNKMVAGELSYIHRTVKDYLEREDVWKDILAHTTRLFEADFEPNLQLLMSWVLSLKRGMLWQAFPPRQVREIIQDKWPATYQCAWELKLS
jgi:hypothetical protein